MGASSLIGRVLGGTYQVLRQLGAGGAGEVYSARHVRTARLYAVKVLRVHVDEAGHRRFKREADALGRLGHAGIVAIHDSAVTEDGIAYLVMDLLEGEDLGARLRKRRLTWTETLWITTHVADAVAAAHDVGIVHRDLKPSNIFLATKPGLREQVVVLDFGMARLTTSDAVLGTPLYMSPEQVSGTAVDARTDVFSLGVLCYEMASGAAPFFAPTVPAVLVRVLSAAPASIAAPHLPAGIDAVLATALTKDPEHRFASLRELSMALQALPAPVETAAPALAPPTLPTLTAATPARQTRNIHRLSAGLALAGLTCVAAAAGIVWNGRSQTRATGATPPSVVIEGATPVAATAVRDPYVLNNTTVERTSDAPVEGGPSGPAVVQPMRTPNAARTPHRSGHARSAPVTEETNATTRTSDELLRSSRERAALEDLHQQIREIDQAIAAARSTRALLTRPDSNGLPAVCATRDEWLARQRDNNRAVASAVAVLVSGLDRVCQSRAHVETREAALRDFSSSSLEVLGNLRASQRIHQDALDRTMAANGL